MKEKKILFERNNLFLIQNKINSSFIICKTFSNNKRIIFTTFLFLVCLLYVYPKNNKSNFSWSKEKISFDKYDVKKYNEIKEKLKISECSLMWANQKEFLNGIIRKFKPRKFLEIGVFRGGSSIIILNAINDIPNSKFYSIDLDSEKFVGDCVKKYFPNYLKNWGLFKGNIATEFIEKIGNNIDFVLFDTAHFEPGEILDFLIVLPFLKNEAIVIFHDIAIQIFSKSREEWAPYIIFNGIRGKKFFPSGNYNLKHNIGAIKLGKNQNQYYKDYFRLLGGEWQYFPKETHINLIRKYFKKYYDKECLMIFEEAIDFNRNFVKNNPKSIFYNKTSD